MPSFRTAMCRTGSFHLAFAALLGAAAPKAHAFAEIENGALNLATTGAVEYDSNIQGIPQGDADFIYSLYPDLLYKENQSQLKVDAGAGVTFERYQKYTEYNSNDADGHLNLDLAPDQGLPLSGLLNIGYAETSDVDYDLNQRVHAKALTGLLNATYPIGTKVTFDVNGSFNRIDRGSDGTQEFEGAGATLNYNEFLQAVNLSLEYNRLESTASSVDGTPPIDQESNSYAIAVSRPIYDDLKTSATYGYRFLDRSAQETDFGQTNVDGPFYSVEVDGPFLPPRLFPKLKSSLSIAYERASTPGIDDEDSNRLVAAASLSWEASDTTKLSIKASHSQELSSTDLTVISTDCFAEISQGIGHFVHADVGGGYEHRQYIGIERTDDVGTGYVRLVYKATKSLEVGLSDQIHATSSDDVLAAYTRNVARLYATYTF